MRRIENMLEKFTTNPRIFVRVLEAISGFILAVSLGFLFLVIALKLLLRCL